MAREMRRKNQQLSRAACLEILQSRANTSGVLAVLGDGGYPYALPLSFVYGGDALYFHCAKSGHKLDAIKRCDKVSFCIVDKDEVVPQEYTTYYRSVIVFGRASIVESDGERRAALRKIAEKYNPLGTPQAHEQEIEKSFAAVCVLKLTIEELTGKEAKELVKQRKA